VEVDAGRVLAFRVAGHGLAAPRGRSSLGVLGSWAVQDSPPGAATAAVLARYGEPLAPGWLDAAIHEDRTAVALYNPRTATAVVPAAEAPAFGTALLPPDDAALKAIVASAVPERSEGFAEPVALAVAAIADALDGTVLSRDDLHEALRARLPAELLPWCEGCQSHHARRGLLVMAALHGRLCVAGRAGRQPAFARTDQWAAWKAPPAAGAGAELVRRYLAAYGPSSPGELAQWAGLGTAHARSLWALVADELVEVAVEGRAGRAWVPAADLDRLADPPPASGVRLLAPGDPLLLGRDREALLPDERARRAVWKPIGGAGVVLSGGRPAALWRARKQGRRLAVTVEAFGAVSREAVAAEAERLAPHRGCTSVALEWGAFA
jgi:Winged helix DNA-binding domain